MSLRVVTVRFVPVAFTNQKFVAEAFATVSQPVLVALVKVRRVEETRALT